MVPFTPPFLVVIFAFVSSPGTGSNHALSLHPLQAPVRVYSTFACDPPQFVMVDQLPGTSSPMYAGLQCIDILPMENPNRKFSLFPFNPAIWVGPWGAIIWHHLNSCTGVFFFEKRQLLRGRFWDLTFLIGAYQSETPYLVTFGNGS